MRREDAERRLRTLARQRGDELVLLAGHAALPVVLNPDFVHLLRINYFLDPPVALPYTAEAQLLLSPLCSEIDDGLYVMDPELRDVLLHRLVEFYGAGRLRDVARLLWEYGQRGTPWPERPGLAEAQQLTALNFIDSPRALAWLERAERGEGASAMEQRWFVAMRHDLTDRATAVERAEAQAVYLPDKLPALTELRDTLAVLYPDSSSVLRIAREVGVDAASLAGERRISNQWQRVLEAAWLLNRVPAVLERAAKDHANEPSLTRAIQEYWIRVTPVLRVEKGAFESPPRNGRCWSGIAPRSSRCSGRSSCSASRGTRWSSGRAWGSWWGTGRCWPIGSWARTLDGGMRTADGGSGPGPGCSWNPPTGTRSGPPGNRRCAGSRASKWRAWRSTRRTAWRCSE